jgi:hypothetical protein
MKTCGDIEMMIVKMKRQWLKTWMYGLREQALTSVSQTCESVIAKTMASYIYNKS